MKLLNRFYLRFAPNKLLKQFSTDTERKAFFIGEYRLMLQRMWRGEFVGEKKKEIREGIRREYDKVNEDLDAVKVNLAKELEQSVRETLEKAAESKKQDIAQLKEQIDALNKEVLDIQELLSGYREGLELLESMINGKS